MPNSQKVAFITGAARRIGAEIAQILHQANINVVLHYHQSHAAAEHLCQQLNDIRPHSASLLQADLCEVALLAQLVQKAAAVWGRLDILVNNASRFYKTKVGDVTDDIWQDLFTSNLQAPFFLSQAALPYLQQQRGCIINIADVHGERAMRDYPIYSMTKAGVLMMTQALAKEIGPDVRVNAVSPGTVVLPEGDNTLSAERREKIISKTALLRYGTALDVAKAVLFLVRDADYVTGQTIVVDGGRSLSI